MGAIMIRRTRQMHVMVFVLVGCAALGTLPAVGDEKPGADAVIQVRNEDGKSIPLAAADWMKLPRSKVEVKGKDDKPVRYEGVSLVEVLRFAKVSFEDHPRGRASAYLVVEGSDGYRVVLALAKVDPKVTDRVLLVADRLDGKPLDDKAGPYRLVVPGDKVPVRWVRQVSRISIRRPMDQAPRNKANP